MSILVLHGPNLNLLGSREPQVYGSTTLDEINADLTKIAADAGAKLAHLQKTQPILIGKQYHIKQVLKGPISPKKQARLQAQVAGWQKRLPHVVEQIAQTQQVLTTHRARLAEHETALAALRAC